MSYRLINANNITFNSDGFITAKNIEKMPCIYADLPNGMDGEHYVLEQEDILDKIRAELTQSIQNGTLKIESGTGMLFRIIDKYKAEREVKE